MNKTLIVVAAVAVLALGGWGVSKKLQKKTKSSSQLVTATIGTIQETVDATGSVLPLNRVEIKPPIAGRMEQLIVDEGASVKQGEILAWMSSSDRAAILDAARAQGPDAFKKWEDSYKPTPIIAPLSGVVILRNVVVGQTVDPSVVMYAMSDKLIVIAQVDESDIGRVHLGMAADVTLDAYPDRIEHGKVFDILYEGKNVSNVIQYSVKVELPRAPSYYRSQMTANISFIVRKKENVTLLPATAVKEASGGTRQVMVPDAENKPEARPVVTGIETGANIEIVSGLEPGERVFVTQGKYVPQQGPQSSPLTFGGARPSGPTGQAPQPRKSGGGGG